MPPIRRSCFSPMALLVMILGSCAGPIEVSRAEPPVDDGWDFVYPDRAREGKSPIDLRSLNEAVAGQSGFVRLSADGNGFVLGDGTPARFWAIGSEVFRNPSSEEIARHVRFLARIGVNMVRLHAFINPAKPDSKITDVNELEIDGIWRFVAEAKKQGIYVTISPYWSHNAEAAKWGIEGQTTAGGLQGLLFFDETLQKGYKAWATALYARPNPYTRIPLSKDPSVAIILVQNEDSLFFWTTQNLKPAQQSRLAARFTAWALKKYGTLEAASKAWSGTSHKDDNLAAGKLGLFDIYQMTIPQAGGMGRRIADQVDFFATLQRQFYEQMVQFYRTELGCGQLINGSNWKTADQTLLDDSERWSNAAAEVIAVNRYYNGGAHVGANNGWRIEPGDKFSQRSALLNPREIPTNLKQVVGHPMMITESTWVSPLAFQGEGPFLTSVYQSLTGVDAFFWFTADAVDFNKSPYFPYQQVKGQQPLLKWTASIPSILGSFPANALLFRKGYVKAGEPVVHEERSMAMLWDRQTPLIAEDPSFDPNRDKVQLGPVKPGEKSTVIDPLAFLVGPVEVKYGGDPRQSRSADLSKYIDPTKGIVRSVTGEVVLDYKVGLCTVDSPRAQGACGFLARAGLIKLQDLSIRSANAYATVLAVPLDDQPLATSKRVLIQISTAARPTGWATKDANFAGEGNQPTAGYEVVSTGKPPWRIADAEFGLSLKNPTLTRATRLDPAGYPAEDVPLTRVKTGITITPPTDTMYLILE